MHSFATAFRMNFLRYFKETFEDPHMVAKIQHFFGVSYKSTDALRVPLEEAQSSEETTAFQRKKSLQYSSSYHEIKDGSQRNDSTLFEDGTPPKAETTDPASTGSKNLKNYTVGNKFWYYLFLVGTYLGDEVGYAVCIPFLIWNFDATVGRRLVLVWTIIMYVGQSIKDVLKWPRPICPPVIRLQKKWSLEHGMPSTHAMVGIAFPSSVLHYSLERYEFPIVYAIIISALWCMVISLSRLYLGMHSVLDVLAGLFLSSVMVIPLLPAVSYVDHVWLNADTYYYPLALMFISLLLLGLYPSEHKWTPTKSDTSVILGTCVGIQTGFWFNHYLMLMQPTNIPPPYLIQMPNIVDVGYGAARIAMGLLCIFASFMVFEVLFKVVDVVLEKLVGIAPRVANGKQHIPFLDLSYKYLSFCISSFHVSFSIPRLFTYLKIGNPSYYLE